MCSFSIKLYIYNYIYLSPSLFLYLPIYPSYLSFNLSLFHALTPFTLFVSLCLSLSLAHFHWSGHQLYHLVVDMLCPPTATLLTYHSPPPPFPGWRRLTLALSLVSALLTLLLAVIRDAPVLFLPAALSHGLLKTMVVALPHLLTQQTVRSQVGCSTCLLSSIHNAFI